MSKESKQTLEIYQAKALDWISCQSRKHNEEPAKYERKRQKKKARLARFLDGMSPNPLVLELGAGTGDDYYLLKDLGCRVLLSDGAQAFVDFMAKKGLEALRVLTVVIGRSLSPISPLIQEVVTNTALSTRRR